MIRIYICIYLYQGRSPTDSDMISKFTETHIRDLQDVVAAGPIEIRVPRSEVPAKYC